MLQENRGIFHFLVNKMNSLSIQIVGIVNLMIRLVLLNIVVSSENHFVSPLSQKEMDSLMKDINGIKKKHPQWTVRWFIYFNNWQNIFQAIKLFFRLYKLKPNKDLRTYNYIGYLCGERAILHIHFSWCFYSYVWMSITAFIIKGGLTKNMCRLFSLSFFGTITEKLKQVIVAYIIWTGSKK